MKPYKHVLIVTPDIDRKVFTRHGLHMNNLGKEKITSKVSMVVTSIFQKQNVVTRLCWKNGYDISVENVSDNQAEDISVTNTSGNSTETIIPL
jgi:N-acyl-L-homoserine lactone synthetase